MGVGLASNGVMRDTVSAGIGGSPGPKFRTRGTRLCWVAAMVMLAAGGAGAQHQPMQPVDTTQKSQPQQRTRLYLKDGSYQLVISYKIAGKVVRYRSAERDGADEDRPLDMVDMIATKKWERDHAEGATPEQQGRAVLSPELAKEEADRAARTPEVAKDLKLPEEDSVLVMDTFEGTPELVPVPQQGSDLNKETAHAVLKGEVNPASAAHRLLDLPGPTSDIQLHVSDPVFFVRVGKDDEEDAGSGAIVVDTHGATGREVSGGGSERSEYVIERLDPRQDSRVVDSFRIVLLDSGQRQSDVIELKAEALPGGHWVKLTPLAPLDFGEYALIEVLSDRAVNLNVWDFGVHSAAKENIEAMRPEPQRAVGLERR